MLLINPGRIYGSSQGAVATNNGYDGPLTDGIGNIA